LAALERAYRLGLTRLVSANLPDDPVEVMGLRFRNPVGLAAGLDKNAAHIDALGSLGFGFVEVGTVTPKPQPGNPRPRLFRLPQANALINRFGFNNEGVAAFIAHVKQQTDFSNAGGVLGLNIGKNATTPVAQALDDYVACLEAVYPVASQKKAYITVNISSPNTQNLRSLQGEQELVLLLRGLNEARARLSDQYGIRVPIAVKIAPDLEPEALLSMSDAMVAHGIDAIIATNTTTARDQVQHLIHGQETGGLSGHPLMDRSTQVVRCLAEHLRGALPIIAVGGILSAEDALSKKQAGATLIQLYTGLIYKGPRLVQDCRRALMEHAQSSA